MCRAQDRKALLCSRASNAKVAAVRLSGPSSSLLFFALFRSRSSTTTTSSLALEEPVPALGKAKESCRRREEGRDDERVGVLERQLQHRHQRREHVGVDEREEDRVGRRVGKCAEPAGLGCRRCALSCLHDRPELVLRRRRQRRPQQRRRNHKHSTEHPHGLQTKARKENQRKRERAPLRAEPREGDLRSRPRNSPRALSARRSRRA